MPKNLNHTEHEQRINRRSFVSKALGLMGGIAASSSVIVPPLVSAGQVGTVNTQGVGLYVHPTNLSAILYMDAGSPVDVLFGPYNGMYEIRYYGTDGWIWAEYLSLGSNTSSAPAVSGSASAPSTAPDNRGLTGEHWIDVSRNSGLVRLMIGDTSVGSYWGSLSRDQSEDGFYATATGTYYVYGFEKNLHYSKFAKNYLTDWVAFDPVRYNGFHSYSKDENGKIVPNGGGNTGGCVALGPGDCTAVYDFATMNMRVEVHS